jgi:hypothetical protein
MATTNNKSTEREFNLLFMLGRSKMDLKERYDGVVQITLIWLRIGTSGRLM